MRLRAFSQIKLLFFPFFLFFFSFFVYLHNISFSVFGGDVGDLASAIAVRGVAHPSGYPLFTMLGILFSYLPFQESLAWKIGFMNTIFSSVSIVLFYIISLRLTKKHFISFISSLALAFFYIFWLYGEIGEVFALVNLFVFLLLLLSILYYQTKRPVYLCLLSFFYGLSLSHHEILIALLPGLFILIARNIKLFMRWNVLLAMILLFFLGVTPYLYIPLAAFTHPVVNWDNPVNLHNFFQLVLRLDYGWKVSAGVDIPLRLLAVKTYAFRLFTELTPAGVFLICVGIFRMFWKRQIYLPTAFLISAILFGPVYVLYGFVPLFSSFIMGVLERFYMISSLFLFLFLPFGIMTVVDLLTQAVGKLSQGEKRSFYPYLFASVFLIIPFSLLRINFPKTDFHTLMLGDNLGKDFLTNLPPHSLLVLEGDTIFFNTEYMHVTQGIRKDVNIVNIGVLGKTPALAKTMEEIKKSNKKLSDDEAYLQALQKLSSYQPVFSSAIIESKKTSSEFVWVPEGIVFHLMKKESELSDLHIFLMQEDLAFSLLHVPQKATLDSLPAHSLTIASLPQSYAQGYVNVGNYLISHFQDIKDAKTYFLKALTIDMSNQNALIGLGYTQTLLGNCTDAEKTLKTVLSIHPDNRTAYIYWYGDALSCFADVKKAQRISDLFSHTFHGSLLKEIHDSYTSSKQ